MDPDIDPRPPAPAEGARTSRRDEWKVAPRPAHPHDAASPAMFLSLYRTRA